MLTETKIKDVLKKNGEFMLENFEALPDNKIRVTATRISPPRPYVTFIGNANYINRLYKKEYGRRINQDWWI